MRVDRVRELVPPAVRDRLVLAAESATLCPPTFTQLLVSRYLAGHDWRSQVKTFTEVYRERRDAMVAALEAHLPPGSTWNIPDGGFYVWVTVPEGVDTKAMLPRAVTARVAYASGTGFYADGTGRQNMRLNFSFSSPGRLREGVRRLAGVMEQDLAMRSMFGTLDESHARRGRRGAAAADTPGPDLA